jgi:peptide/nickel transport system permease protein
MTQIGIMIPPPDGLPLQPEEAAPSQSFLRQVVGIVLRSYRARLGLIWIGLLVIGAVFAPFLASSHPILMKSNGQWSSPLLRHLSAGDFSLQVCFWSALAIYFWPGLRPGTRWIIWIALNLVAITIFCITIHPSDIVVYDQYRTAQRDGHIDQAIYSVIPYSPNDHQRDVMDMRLKPPSALHWMGTTADSADLLSNLIHASRVALSIGFISTSVALVIGVILGGLMGYYAGWIDLFGMRLAEIFDAIPTLMLLLCFVAIFPPQLEAYKLYFMMAIIGATNWVGYAYFVRAEFLSLRDRDFVQAAKVSGLPLYSILFKHMLPNGITPVIVTASFGVASAILAESTLSFLGIGLVSEASWGNLLEQARGEGGTFYWWIALYPGLAIFLTVFAYNLIGEVLRDALDPKLRSN